MPHMQYRTSAILNFRQSYGHLNIASLYGGCMESRCIGKSNTNNLPAPTDLTENPYEKKKLFFKDATQKSASLVPWGIAVESEPTKPIFEKCPHLRERGGCWPKLGLMGNRLSCIVGILVHTQCKIVHTLNLPGSIYLEVWSWRINYRSGVTKSSATKTPHLNYLNYLNYLPNYLPKEPPGPSEGPHAPHPTLTTYLDKK